MEIPRVCVLVDCPRYCGCVVIIAHSVQLFEEYKVNYCYVNKEGHKLKVADSIMSAGCSTSKEYTVRIVYPCLLYTSRCV